MSPAPLVPGHCHPLNRNLYNYKDYNQSLL